MTPLVVDATGLGSPVVEMLRGALSMTAHNAGPSGRLCASVRCEMRPVVITDGSGARYGNGQSYVAKSDLMTWLRVAMERRDLKIAMGMEGTRSLVRELTGFGGPGHDDMVMARALAVWGSH